jgi:hypothetical protein
MLLKLMLMSLTLTIDILFAEQGQGRHMLEMEFEPRTETEVEYSSRRTGKLTKRWTWKHKLKAGQGNSPNGGHGNTS